MMALQTEKSPSHIPISDTDHGYFNSVTIALPPNLVFNACKDERNIHKTLSDLPKDIENFLDLNFISAEQRAEDYFEIKWDSENSQAEGSLSFIIRKAPGDQGSIVYAFALFERLHWREEGPSNLMNIFLKRMKALIETGEIATTKGQPSGREELRTIH